MENVISIFEAALRQKKLSVSPNPQDRFDKLKIERLKEIYTDPADVLADFMNEWRDEIREKFESMLIESLVNNNSMLDRAWELVDMMEKHIDELAEARATDDQHEEIMNKQNNVSHITEGAY